MTTANRAWSTRRRRSISAGRNDPVRSLGIRSARSPASVDSLRGREPLRWLLRDGLRSQRLGADRGRQLGLDQCLVHRLGRDPHAFIGIACLVRVQDSE